MSPRELTIGLTLLVPTLVIGFWPKIAIDFYETSTNALANNLLSHNLMALKESFPIG